MTDRFDAALRALWVPEDAAFGVAVSGGPDSLAMLVMAHHARPGKLHAATVDHGLRPEATAEAERVAAVCRGYNVPHEILSVRVEGSVQAAAREARYQALGDWCAREGLAWLATAHHADDQAETLLLRAVRGAGLSGLAGVRRSRPLRPGVRLIRPLLDWRKHELEAVVAGAGLHAELDPSNEDPAYDRSAARKLLGTTAWLNVDRIARSAAHLAEAELALEWSVALLAHERILGDSLDPSDLPSELVRRLMLRLFARFGQVPRGPELQRLMERLTSGKPGTLGAVKVTPGPRWTFALAPARRGDQ